MTARFKVEEGLEAVGNSAITGNLTVTDTLYIGNNSFEFNTNSIGVVSSANIVVDSYESNQYKFAKYFITAKNPANTLLHALEAIVVNETGNVYITTYGEVWNQYPLILVSGNVSSGIVNIIVTPTANSLPLSVSSYRSVQA